MPRSLLASKRPVSSLEEADVHGGASKNAGLSRPETAGSSPSNPPSFAQLPGVRGWPRLQEVAKSVVIQHRFPLLQSQGSKEILDFDMQGAGTPRPPAQIVAGRKGSERF